MAVSTVKVTVALLTSPFEKMQLAKEVACQLSDRYRSLLLLHAPLFGKENPVGALGNATKRA